MEVARQSHTVLKNGTMCNDFHFSCCFNHTPFPKLEQCAMTSVFASCVNHTRLALANCHLQNSLWDRKPSAPNSKKIKENPHHPHVTKTLTPPPPPLVPIHTCTSSSASMHGTAYRGGNHLARHLPLRESWTKGSSDVSPIIYGAD